MPQSMKPYTHSPLTKTANRDAVTRLVNTLFNPMAREKILTPPNSDPASRALYHAGGLAIGYGGLAFVLRKLINRQQELDRQRDVERLVAYNEARFPTMSVGTKPGTERQEAEVSGVTPGDMASGFGEELPELGTAETNTLFKQSALDKRANWAAALIREMTGTHDTAHLAMAAAATILGGVGGWQIADYQADRKRREQLEKRIQQNKTLIDTLAHKEYVRTRGLPETPEPAEAVPGVDIGEPEKVAAEVPVTPHTIAERYRTPMYAKTITNRKEPGAGSVIGNAANPENWPRAVATMWWIWAAAAFALTYRAAKVYSDKTDPARARLKELQDIAEARARSSDAPVLMEASPLEELQPAPKKSTVPRQTSGVHVRSTAEAPRESLEDMAKPAPATTATQRRAKQVTTGPATSTPVDPKDPYANLLNQ